MISTALLHALAKAGGVLRQGEPMAAHTSMQVGGPADLFFAPGTQEALALALTLARQEGLPVHLCGAGSNLLVGDAGVRGLVVQIGEALGGIRWEGDMLIAQAGARLSQIAQEAYCAGREGLSFAQGIPGTVGGGLSMNAGAYGGDLSQVCAWVEVLDKSGRVLRVDRGDMDFGYRHSAVEEQGWVVLSAGFALQKGDREAIGGQMRDYAARRREKQPLSLPSAGSVFKRPKGHFAGALIEAAGCKGLQVGGAQVSEMHAGFIVNRGNATGDEVLALIALVQKRVQEHSGVWLEPEVRVLE